MCAPSTSNGICVRWGRAAGRARRSRRDEADGHEPAAAPQAERACSRSATHAPPVVDADHRASPATALCTPRRASRVEALRRPESGRCSRPAALRHLVGAALQDPLLAARCRSLAHRARRAAAPAPPAPRPSCSARPPLHRQAKRPLSWRANFSRPAVSRARRRRIARHAPPPAHRAAIRHQALDRGQPPGSPSPRRGGWGARCAAYGRPLRRRCAAARSRKRGRWSGRTSAGLTRVPPGRELREVEAQQRHRRRRSAAPPAYRRSGSASRLDGEPAVLASSCSIWPPPSPNSRAKPASSRGPRRGPPPRGVLGGGHVHAAPGWAA